MNMSSCVDLQSNYCYCLPVSNSSSSSEVTKAKFVKSKPIGFSFFSITRLKPISFLVPLLFLFLCAILLRKNRYFSRTFLFANSKLAVRTDTTRQPLNFPKVSWFNSPGINPPLILQGWRTMTQLGSKGMPFFTQCSVQYGKSFLLPFGPLNVLATSDLQIISKLLSSNDPCHLHKSGYIYKRLFVPELHDGLFASRFSVWFPHRKCLSRGLTYKSILSYLGTVNKHAWELTSNILKCAEHSQDRILQDGKIFSECLGLQLLSFTGDLITGPGTFSRTNIAKIRESIETHKECLLYVFQHPYLFLRSLWNKHPRKIVSDRATQQMHHAMRQMIANHKSQRSKDCNNQHKANDQDDERNPTEMKFKPLLELMTDNQWSEKEILDNFATFIFAEHEAMFAGIQFTLLQLALHPEHQVHCRTEVDSVFTQQSSTSSLSITNLSQLKYLELCILETLRLTPPVPIFARRLQAPLKISNSLQIPSGQTVMVMPWVLHRDPSLYPEPHSFDPNRFSGESVRTRPPYAYLPFSAGRRNCLGWKLSQIQMKVMLAWILRHFEISTTDNLESVKLFYAVRIIPERDFNLIFKPRQI